MLAGGPMQVYRARNPKKSLLWQIAHRHLLKRLCTLAHESLTEYLRTALGCPEGVPGIIMTLHTFLSQQQDARCPPAGLAAGAGSAPGGRFATTTAQAPVQEMARPDPPRLAC